MIAPPRTRAPIYAAAGTGTSIFAINSHRTKVPDTIPNICIGISIGRSEPLCRELGVLLGCTVVLSGACTCRLHADCICDRPCCSTSMRRLHCRQNAQTARWGTGTERIRRQNIQEGTISCDHRVVGSGMQCCIRVCSGSDRHESEAQTMNAQTGRHTLGALNDSGVSMLLWRPVKGTSAIPVAPEAKAG